MSLRGVWHCPSWHRVWEEASWGSFVVCVGVRDTEASGAPLRNMGRAKHEGRMNCLAYRFSSPFLSSEFLICFQYCTHHQLSHSLIHRSATFFHSLAWKWLLFLLSIQGNQFLQYFFNSKLKLFSIIIARNKFFMMMTKIFLKHNCITEPQKHQETQCWCVSGPKRPTAGISVFFVTSWFYPWK